MIGILLLFGVADAQSYRIKVKISGYKNDTLMLGYHYGGSQYIKDTAFRKNDEFVFKGDSLLEEGMYLLVTKPDHNFLQILIEKDHQDFSLETHISDLIKFAKFKNSKINTRFFDYISFVSKERAVADSIGKKYQSSVDSIFRKKSEEQLNQIDKTVNDYQNKLIKDEGNSLLSLLIRSTKDVEMPVFTGSQEEVRDKNYRYYKAHYFDNTDFTDNRTVRLPFFQGKIEKYFSNLVMLHPDSISKELDEILTRCGSSNEVFKYLLSTQLTDAANSKYVGMDGVYVHLVENYYSKGRAPWIDEESKAKIIRDAKALKPLLIDKIAPDFVVFRQDSTPITLHSVKANYTVLLIWAPDCSHCKKSMPYFIDFYQKYKSKGVEIFAVCNKSGQDEKSCWEHKDFSLGSWINTSDPKGLSNYKYLYDVKSTPQVYVLDKDKRILTKKIAGEQLSEVMDKLLKIAENETN